jgi:hypothetical protein
MNNAHVGELRVPWRIPNRGIAAARVPAQKPALTQRHARKYIESGGEVHMFRKRSDDLGAAVLVDDSRRVEKARVRLTVLAIADGSHSRCGGHDIALKRAAATSKWMVHASELTTSAVRAA